MRVELLVVPGCPHEGEAASLLREALDDTGYRDVAVHVQVMTLQTVGAHPQFGGSPTVLINGVDPFAHEQTPQVGLSCRIYPNSLGVGGVPSLEDLRTALSP